MKHSTAHSLADHTNSQMQSPSKVTLVSIIKNSKAFDLFMEHVLSVINLRICLQKKKKKIDKEFSSEHLLCYLELCQYRQSTDLTTHPKYRDDELFVLGPDMPRSMIAYDQVMSPKEKAIALINKYIRPSSRYEINISFEIRMQMLALLPIPTRTSTLLDSLAAPDYVFLFDQVLKELLGVMRDNYTDIYFFTTLQKNISLFKTVAKRSKSEFFSLTYHKKEKFRELCFHACLQQTLQ
ncbi:hypothetical protein RFI_27214 [Reticulomyxa filosa]|uniref:RGS domain-containing protein n=1 Tax=Reticulomyxa filosa TaxID=46433 RepID=X6M924_RETFI|nr:hypothetical protein RFI_27214 [Reticulomyxa filosa]|eukprot:ETO10161.1 hypothetical protein RFI_27214 [Reticulomyxa filosa]